MLKSVWWKEIKIPGASPPHIYINKYISKINIKKNCSCVVFLGDSFYSSQTGDL